MYTEFKYEAGVSLECRSCNRRTTVPALKVEQGIKCNFCSADLTVDAAALAMKSTLLNFAAKRNDTKVD